MVINPIIKYRDRMSQHFVTHTLQKYCTWTFFFKWMNFTRAFVLRNDLQVKFCSNCSVINSINTATLLTKKPIHAEFVFSYTWVPNKLTCLNSVTRDFRNSFFMVKTDFQKSKFNSSHWLCTVVPAVLLFNGLLEVFFPEDVWQE